ncbi:MAG: hypothetical protein L3K00_08395 [Thermoplasmata archaeon]|nr:hypothetical protein [Thermoplasmata archaeon]
MHLPSTSGPRGAWLPTLAVVLLILLVAVGVVTIAPGLVGPGSPTLDGALQVGGVVAYPPSTFWSVGTHAVKIENSSLSAQVNETPIENFRFGGGSDSTNQTTGVSYSDDGVASAPSPAADAPFVQFCEWRRCHAIMAVPGEINDPGAAAVTVAYVENTLGFHPEFWSIGNEPQAWTHYNIPWTDWRGTDDSQVTPTEYAALVHRDIAAMRGVDPTIRVIGIQSETSGTAGAIWMQPLVAMNGPNLSAVAYHSYPGSSASPGSSVGGFLDAAVSHGFPSDYRATEASVSGACPTCHIPVFVDEFNGALAGPYSSYVQSYPDVPVVADAVAEGLQLNTSQFSFFDLQATSGLSSFGLVDASGLPRPTFTLYSTFFENLSVHAVDNTTIFGGPGGATAVVGTNATTVSLLVSNANASYGLRLSLNGSGFPTGQPGSVWSWNPNEAIPMVIPSGATPLASSWLIPPEGILLLDVTV